MSGAIDSEATDLPKPIAQLQTNDNSWLLLVNRHG